MVMDKWPCVRQQQIRRQLVLANAGVTSGAGSSKPMLVSNLEFAMSKRWLDDIATVAEQSVHPCNLGGFRSVS